MEVLAGSCGNNNLSFIELIFYFDDITELSVLKLFHFSFHVDFA